MDGFPWRHKAEDDPSGGARGEGEDHAENHPGLALGAVGLMPMPATAQTTHTCFGEVAETVGTRGDDELLGDVVVGLAGSDGVYGRLVCGGKGDEWVVSGVMVDAGPGDDEEIRGHGPLTLGGTGNDEMWDYGTEFDPDQVWRGGEGHDAFHPHSGVDVFYGGAGDDSTSTKDMIVRTSGKLRAFGGDGNDHLDGLAGKDKLYGEAGNDTLNTAYGDDNADFVDGGDGFDTCLVHAGDRAVNCEDVTVFG